MAVIKVYTRINWLNKSESLTTPLGKTNLNKMDKAINLIDDEVVSMSAKVDEIDTTKVSADQLNNMVTDVSFNDNNGVISITKYNGTVLNIDTAIEKIAVNFEYNAQTQQLILTLENGEKQYIDMSALITQYEFKDTDTIAFSVDSSGKVSASIKSGSITKAMLSSEVMSAITLSENNAAASAQAAAQSATNAELDAKLSQSYSVGKSGIRDGEDTDNSKYYSEQAKKYANEAQEIAGGNFIPNSEKGVANGVAVLDNNLAVEKANKLATARTIALRDSVTGSGTFDGSGNLSIATKRRGCSVGQIEASTTNPYYKFASLKTTSEYSDYSITFKVYTGYADDSKSTGILTAHFRTSGSLNAVENRQLVWEYANSGIDTTKFFLCYKVTPGTDVIVELYVCIDEIYKSYHFEVLAEGSRVANANLWTLYNAHSEGQSPSLPSGYISMKSSLSTIKNPISGNAATAISDKNGNDIVNTYATKKEIAEAIEVDSELSTTSMNPVQNKVITQALQEKADKSETTVNFINPTLQTTTKNGVTCTNNGDGTYKISGTATKATTFSITSTDRKLSNILIADKTYRLVGNSKKSNIKLMLMQWDSEWNYIDDSANDLGEGTNVKINPNTYYVRCNIAVESGVPCDNLVLKPMLTTNLDATYDDFVPYTGDTGSLNGDVAQLQDSKADKTEVPKLVKVDNKTVFLSEDGVLSAKGGGSSIKPKPVSDVSIVSAKSKVTIKWTDPTDIVVDGAVLSQWQKTVLMYKQGTVPPTSLNDGTIAVEETKRNQYQSTGYTVTGLTDGNDYSFSLFAISTDGTSSDKVSVSAKLYATLKVTTEEASLYGKAVTVTSGSQKVTSTFSNSGSVSLRIPWLGNTTISATDGTDTTTATVNIAKYGKSYNAELSFFKIVTFADGTDEEIAKMIQAHYNNKINIADYWAVGDKRKVNLSAMSATGVGESHRAQAVEFAIAGFEHDDLTTAINGHTKAAVTLTQVDCLMDAECEAGTKYGSNNTENGYINSSNTNVGGWESCARRTWCNSVYYNALPSALKNAVKEVNKKTSAGNQSTTIKTTADKIFLLSEIECFGSNTYSVAGEGTQYQYYKNAVANIYKLPKWNSSYNTSAWWQRSPYPGNNATFCYVAENGTIFINNAPSSKGFAPCLCI